MGRLDRYESHVQPHLAEIREWVGTMSEGQICKRLGIGMTSFAKYKREHEELREAVRGGREQLIEDLKSSLKKKAKGFEYTETKTIIREEAGKKVKVIEQYHRYSPPDTGAIHLLLKNLDDTWRNDDRETMDLKAKKLELERQKAEAEDW